MRDLDDLPDELGPDGLHPSADTDSALRMAVCVLLVLLIGSLVTLYALFSLAFSLIS